ncbi:class II 3-deoxy-7-phosphoheptulonate synthase [Streptomyces sp. WZ-12]|uniref:class II 3-deoxy-7-phosphoheptulonate synthase n=1 Tax=Streptomyces sp. WZ-12 TaxID=3030210 RepID=UPI002380DA41|nr:3-deoxy-7-phosphoheptulonate synthase class II [Streptomyces sp. WZ-12]
MNTWSNHRPSTTAWRGLPAAQQPSWPDPVALEAVLAQLHTLPPLVLAHECDTLRERLAEVARGNAFLLQGGDCAESFKDATAQAAAGVLATLRQMAAVLGYAASTPVTTVGRIAGQYAKPRSAPTETRGGVTLPSYRGDCINAREFTAQARTPDPRRLNTMYQRSAATLNLIRALTAAGHAGLDQVHAWNREFVLRSPLGKRYEHLLGEIETALAFLRTCGPQHPGPGIRPTEFYVSHEALLLDYESALTTADPRTGRRYAGSAHLLWIGERTRALEGAHIAFAAEIANPLAVKLGPTTTPQDALALVQRLDAAREPGRLTFITRMGKERIREVLPPVVEAVTRSGALVAWLCDPMHGNTFQAPTGHKTRHLDDILDEVTGFFDVHRTLGTHPGGLHIELTGSAVTECLGGGDALAPHDLSERYETSCDPRLNHNQSMDLAFHVAQLYRQNTRPGPVQPNHQLPTQSRQEDTCTTTSRTSPPVPLTTSATSS